MLKGIIMEEKADFELLCDTHIGENHMVGIECFNNNIV